MNTAISTAWVYDGEMYGGILYVIFQLMLLRLLFILFFLLLCRIIDAINLSQFGY